MQGRRHVSIYISVAILLALTVCGSVWDRSIAYAVYMGETPADNLFGVIFSFIGILPTFVGWSFLGASILYLSKKQVEDVKKRRWLTAFAILLLVLSFFYFCNTLYFSNANSVKIPFLVAYSVGIAVIAVAAFLGYRLSAKSDNRELLKRVLFLAVVSLVTLLIVSCTKKIMCRPRFRFVLTMDEVDFFINWWQSGRGLMASLDLTTVTDEFASLPSGHSAYSMFAVFLFPALGDYVRGLGKFKPHLTALGLVWWAVTAFSRMTLGAHYLTDVAIAGLVAIFSYAVVSAAKRILSKRRTQ